MIHQRGQVKGKVTSIANALEKAEDDPTLVSLPILKVYAKKLEAHYNEYNSLHKEILCSVPPNKIDEQDEKMIEFDKLHTESLIQLEILIEILSVPKSSPTASGPSTSATQVIVQQQPLRAPIPTFDGRYENWPRFRSMFEDIIGRCSDSDAIKLHHLEKALVGEASGIIDSKTLADNNYHHAWEILIDRYENPRIIIDTHIDGLLAMKKMSKESHKELRALVDTCTRHVEGLKFMKQPVKDTAGLIINKILTSCLDASIRKQWERSLSREELPNLDKTLTFLKDQCRILERCEVDSHTTVKSQSVKSSQQSVKPPNLKVHASISNSNSNNESCQLCGEGHYNYQCPDFLKLSVSDRVTKVRECHLCFNCLRRGHRSTNCMSKKSCSKCNKRHHLLLHVDASTPDSNCASGSPPDQNQRENRPTTLPVVTQSQTEPNAPSDSTALVSSSCSLTAKVPNVLLLTAVVNLVDKHNQLVRCRAFLDCGAQTNLISVPMYQRLGIEGTSVNVDIVGVSNARSKSNRLVTVNLQSLYNDFQASLRCLVTPKITNVLPSQKVNISQWGIPHGFRLADPQFHVPSEVDLLIGMNHFFSLLRTGHLVLGDGLPELRETELGWVVSGEIRDESIAVVNPQQVNAVTIESLHELIKRFWEIEEISNSSQGTAEEEECEEIFRQSHRRDSSGRYVVRLPFRDNVSQLNDNRSLALRRFFLLERRLLRDQQLHTQYSDFVKEYKTLGHCREVREADDPPGLIKYYIPHHAVLRPSSSSTKLRVVFDASAKASGGTSLNDVLQVGAVVQSSLETIILRFRKHTFVFTADIAKMFRQVFVDPLQTAFLRIFWRSKPSDVLKVFELLTVTYGTSCTPFLATRALLQLCVDEGDEFPLAAHAIREDCYVDDILSGSSSIETAVKCRQQIQQMLQRGGFPVHKWCANHSAILEGVPESDRETLVPLNEMSANEVIKTLGLLWNTHADEFLFSINSNLSDSAPVTKRTMFSEIAKLFDPIGLVSPVIVLAKQLMQATWSLKIGWDTPLDGDILHSWIHLRSSLTQIQDLRIPRHVMIPQFEYAELHGFADASGIAYGACLYVRCVTADGTVSVRLLCSKSRIAPLQELTIPRKELCAALLLSKLVKRTVPAMQFEFSSIFLWSDSQIVLAWLRKPPSMLQPFVRNRVTEITVDNDHKQWNFVRSRDNPADVVSRGQLPDVLNSNSLWWKGPDFLRSISFEQPDIKEIPDTQLPDVKPTPLVIMPVLNADDLPVFKRFCSFRKLQRVLAYVQRFITNCRTKLVESRVKQSLPTIQELQSALHTIVKVIQHDTLHDEIQRVEDKEPCRRIGMLGPFLDDGVLRVGGRIQHSRVPYYTKHQYILPNHPLTDLIIRAYHVEHLHVGPSGLLSALRQRFWLLGSRSAVRKITRGCVRCFRVKPKRTTQYMGSLPEIRVVPAAPFEISGVDYAGPFLIKQGSRKPTLVKAYIAVFVCMVTKSIHLELVSDMTSAAFIAALQRFVSRRGLIRELHSDNGSNFRGARTELHDLFILFRDYAAVHDIEAFCQTKEIVWHFIPPEAPEFGGLWEAAVKSTKYHLKRILKEKPLSFEEFYTLLTQIEAILNSRPLFSCSDDPTEADVITPGHFLINRPMTAIPEPTYEGLKENRLSKWQHLQKMREHFWKSWSHDYLVNLQPRGKNRVRLDNVAPGTVVLVEDTNLPPQQWKLGKVVQTYPGDDGMVRVVDVKVGNTIFRRPITKISVLPIEKSSPPVPTSNQSLCAGEDVRNCE